MAVSTKTRHLRHLLLMAVGQEEVGRRIRQAREEAGMTQPQLAQAIGLKHPQSISNYERGVTEVPTRKLQRIAEATKKNMAFFVGQVTEELSVSEVAALRADVQQLLVRLGRIEGALGVPQENEDAPPQFPAANGN